MERSTMAVILGALVIGGFAYWWVQPPSPVEPPLLDSRDVGKVPVRGPGISTNQPAPVQGIIRVYDLTSGQGRDLPSMEAWAAYQSGKYGFTDDQELPMRNRWQEIVKVRGKDVGAALEQGFTPATEAEWERADKAAKSRWWK